MIALIDYGMGNLASVRNALHYLGAETEICLNPGSLEECEAFILPGVGAFDEAMERLRAGGMASGLRRAIDSGKPFLGICLGLQLLFRESEEGAERGLDILPGKVLHFPQTEGLLLPHMGWNALYDVKDPVLREGSYMYFVHSYYVCPEQAEIVSARSCHGISFPAAVRQGNITAFQFHPEKSGSAGLEVLKSWLESWRK